MLNTRVITIKVVRSAKVYYLGIKAKVFDQMRPIKTVRNFIKNNDEACASSGCILQRNEMYFTCS